MKHYAANFLDDYTMSRRLRDSSERVASRNSKLRLSLGDTVNIATKALDPQTDSLWAILE